MKTIVSENKIITIIGAFILVMVAGVASAANGNKANAIGSNNDQRDQMQQVKDDRQAAAQDRVCEKMAENAERLQERLRAREENQQQRKIDSENRLQLRIQERDASLDQRRQLRDQNREQSYENLQLRVSTDEQQAAVAEFKNEVEKAVTVRRAAVDAAIDTFHLGVQQAVENKNSKVDGLIAQYNQQRARVASEAQNFCNKGDVTQAQQTLQNRLQQSREEFKISQDKLPNVGTQVKELAQVKNTAIRTASEAFTATIKAAQDKLNEVLNNQIPVLE